MNPYDKYLSKEDILHSQVVTYLRLKYPNVFWMHTPNEGKRTKFEQYKAKKLGITSGVPDLLIFHNSTDINRVIQQNGNGLAIELKVKPNKVTINQEQCMIKLQNAGWECKVCYTFEEAQKTIDEYLTQYQTNKAA